MTNIIYQIQYRLFFLPFLLFLFIIGSRYASTSYAAQVCDANNNCSVALYSAAPKPYTWTIQPPYNGYTTPETAPYKGQTFSVSANSTGWELYACKDPATGRNNGNGFNDREKSIHDGCVYNNWAGSQFIPVAAQTCIQAAPRHNGPSQEQDTRGTNATTAVCGTDSTQSTNPFLTVKTRIYYSQSMCQNGNDMVIAARADPNSPECTSLNTADVAAHPENYTRSQLSCFLYFDNYADVRVCNSPNPDDSQTLCNTSGAIQITSNINTYQVSQNDNGGEPNPDRVNSICGQFTSREDGYYEVVVQAYDSYGVMYGTGNIYLNYPAPVIPSGDILGGSCDLSGLHLNGWACDGTHPNTSNSIMFSDGNSPIYPIIQGTANASDQVVPGTTPPYITSYCKDSSPNHGFNITKPYNTLPSSFTAGTPHTIYGYSFQYNPDPLVTLGGQPMLHSSTITCPVYSPSWIQTKGEDVRIEPMNNSIPSASVCGNQGYTSVVNANGTPGITFGGSSNQSFGTKGGSASFYNWQVGNVSYPELYSPIRRTSVAYIRQTLKQQGITPTELSVSNVGGNCTRTGGVGAGDYLDCKLAGLAGGTPANPQVYIASGNLTLDAATLNFTSGSYVIIVTGTLVILGEIHVSPGSAGVTGANVTFATGAIAVSGAIGQLAGPSCSPTANLEGLYSADGNIFFPSGATCSSNIPDRQIAVAGALVANAGNIGGKLINARDLCANNPNYPSLTVTERPDLVLTMPLILEQTPSTFKEVAP